MSFANKKGITVASGFKLQAATLLDARGAVETIAERDELVTLHAVTDGLKVFVKAEKKTYTWDGEQWVNEPTPSDLGDLGSSIGEITSKVGKANGIASLDGSGKVPSSQLPSYVDDVIEVAMATDLSQAVGKNGTSITPESDKIYVDCIGDNASEKTYRWSGTAFVEISESLALGETEQSAFDGKRGKEAYDHSKKTSGNPHKVTKSDVGLGNVPNVTTDNQTPSFTQATTLENIKTAEKLSVMLGKIAKAIADFITHKGDKNIHITSSERTQWNEASALDSVAFSQDTSTGKLLLAMKNKSANPDNNTHKSPITFPVATSTSDGVMSKEMVATLENAAKAEVNQNAFSNIKAGSATVAADTKTDTLEIEGKDGIVVTGDVALDKLTFKVAVDETALDKAISDALNPATA